MALFLVAAIALPGLWIVRNQVSIENASWTQIRGGSTGVLTLRTEFGLMTADEYRTAWVYWSTPTTGPQLARDHLAPASYERLNRKSDDGFYQTNRRSDGRVERSDTGGAMRLYLSELPKQAALTPLIAWRGTVPWAQFGIPNGPSWQPRLRMVQEHFYRLLLPAFLWQFARSARRRDGQMLLLLAPMTASIAFHATLTHYLPRYSVPVAPIGAMLIIISLAPAVIWAATRARRLAVPRARRRDPVVSGQE